MTIGFRKPDDEPVKAGLGQMRYFWCPACDAIQDAYFEGANNIDTTGNYEGGDIVCKQCSFVIATAYHRIPGKRIG